MACEVRKERAMAKCTTGGRLIMSCCAWLVLIFLVCNQARADDPYSTLWETQTSAVRSLEATFTRHLGDGSPKEHWTRIDLDTGWLRGTVVTTRISRDGREEILEDEYGLTDTVSWSSRGQKDGTRRIDLTSPKSPLYPKALQLSGVGYPWLRHTFLPYHISLREQKGFKMDLLSRSPSSFVEGGDLLVYAVEAGGDAGEISYDVDFSDGIRIYRTEVRTQGRIVERIENRNFTKCAGIWVAFESEQKEFDVESADKSKPLVRASSLVEVKQLSLNKSYVSGDFAPSPKNGDLVVDSIAGIRYRYGAPRDVSILTEEPGFPGDRSAAPGTQIGNLSKKPVILRTDERGQETSTGAGVTHVGNGESPGRFLAVGKNPWLLVILGLVLAFGIVAALMFRRRVAQRRANRQ